MSLYSIGRAYGTPPHPKEEVVGKSTMRELKDNHIFRGMWLYGRPYHPTAGMIWQSFQVMAYKRQRQDTIKIHSTNNR